eukprot:TRINITY_DN67241_c2_g1_i2.p1 TRINITY_DN67241_c2_g1~~TRINITY_DN67241_c2_g1_i2.p1  ORF type:complete len:398 (-),score=37.67 TRINITY_DN67241_c2_g1_i2:640-1833(-)
MNAHSHDVINATLEANQTYIDTEEPPIEAELIAPSAISKAGLLTQDGSPTHYYVEPLKALQQSPIHSYKHPTGEDRGRPLVDRSSRDQRFVIPTQYHEFTTNRGVNVVVGSTYKQLVLNPKHDCLLHLYSDRSPETRAVAANFAAVGEMLQGTAMLRVCKIDIDANAYNPSISFVEFGPSIRFFCNKEGEQTTVTYKGNNTVESLLEFVNNNARSKINIEDCLQRIAKRQEEQHLKLFKKVVLIKSSQHFETLVTKRDDSELVVCQFTASWFGPFNKAHTQFAQLSTQYSCTFVRVNVDELPPLHPSELTAQRLAQSTTGSIEPSSNHTPTKHAAKPPTEDDLLISTTLPCYEFYRDGKVVDVIQKSANDIPNTALCRLLAKWGVSMRSTTTTGEGT